MTPGLAQAPTESEQALVSARVVLIDDDRCASGTLHEALGGAQTTLVSDPRQVDPARTVADLIVARSPATCTKQGALVSELRSRYPGVPLVLFAKAPSTELVVAGLRRGVSDFLDERCDASRIGDLLADLAARSHDAPVYASARSRQCFELAARVAATDVSVLLSGESGTGKEVIARFIHHSSPRHAGPFVGVNCAAIPEHMMEATLFGHEKGAFTGAHQTRAGKFELAEGGTLLLDEISEMGLELQAKLLRVLQEREVERIGARAGRAIDVRVLATSNRDLQLEVREGRFREDLFYRLSVFPLQVPALRERPDDILPLALWFLRKHGPRIGTHNARLSAASIELLEAHAWPGNVRELENALQRALVLADGEVLEPDHFQLDGMVFADPETTDLAANVKSTEESLIFEALERCSGRRKDAARELGISERTLRHKLQKLREREVLAT